MWKKFLNWLLTPEIEVYKEKPSYYYDVCVDIEAIKYKGRILEICPIEDIDGAYNIYIDGNKLDKVRFLSIEMNSGEPPIIRLEIYDK